MSKVTGAVIKDLKANAKALAEKRKTLTEVTGRLDHMRAEKAKGYSIDQEEQHKLMLEKDRLQREIRDGVTKAEKSAMSIYDAEIERLRVADFPKGAEISEDAVLLKSGIKLKAEELADLMKKPENDNSTMFRLFSQYAEENKITLPVTSRFRAGNADIIKGIEDEKAALQYVTRWIDRDDAESMIDRMLAGAMVDNDE